MTLNQKSQFYLEMIKRSHESFRDYLTHIPEDVLQWKAHELMYSTSWLIEHVIHDQVWIANIIVKDVEQEYHCEKKSEKMVLDDIVQEYDNMVSKVETDLQVLTDEMLSELRTSKGYSLTVEDWIFEYIHHLHQHGGEIGYILTVWKRKRRALQDD